MVAKDVDIFEVAGGPIFKFEAQEVADIRWGTTTEFDGNCRCKVSWKKENLRESICGIRISNKRKPAYSGCSATIPVWWKNEMKGWYVVSINMN